jgi:diacylglycerol kinase family enzyme
MKHVFVFDPKAFYNQQWKMDNILDNIGQFFRTQEKPDFSIQISRYRRNAIGIIHEEAEKAKPGDVIRVYAIGGEEILYDCINGAAHFPNMQIAIMPYGESNDFLKIFGENKEELFRDIASLVQAEALPTDVIRWGVNYALNSCYIGMNPVISKKLKDLKSNLNKVSFILFSKISTFLSLIVSAFDKQVAARKYKITIDGEDYSGSYSLIHVANGPYYAGKLTGASHATPDDGLLDVTLIKSAHPLKTLLSLRRYSRGKQPKKCVYVQAKKVSVQSDENMWIQLDNEYVQDSNISLSLVDHAVQMVAVKDLTYPLASILPH